MKPAHDDWLALRKLADDLVLQTIVAHNDRERDALYVIADLDCMTTRLHVLLRLVGRIKKRTRRRCGSAANTTTTERTT